MADKGLYFYSEFCSGCKPARVVIDQLISEGYSIELIDAKKQKDMSRKYKITAVPVLIVLRDEQEVARLVGPEKITPEEVKNVFRKSDEPNYPLW